MELEKGDLTVSFLFSNLVKSAVTLKIKELEKLGLVVKKQSEEDKRVYYLRVNEKFLEEYKSYERVLYAALEEIQDNYSKKDIENLRYVRNH